MVFEAFPDLHPQQYHSMFNTAWNVCWVLFRSLERAKGAEKASCGETVVQKGLFGQSVFSLPLYGLLLKHHMKSKAWKPQGAEKKRTLQKRSFGQPLLRTTDAFSAFFGAPQVNDGSS